MRSIVVLWKRSARAHVWVDDHYEDDPASYGASDADRSALAVALESASSETVITVLTLGPTDCEGMLRDALASGAHSAVLLHTATENHDATTVARTLATHCPPADLILAGDIGDTGLVPSLVAAHLGVPAVVATLKLSVTDKVAKVHRRLEGGRRQDLDVALPALIAVESGMELPRASLSAMLEAQHRSIETIAVAALPASEAVTVPWVGPDAWVAPPEGPAVRRIEVLTGNAGGPNRGRKEVACEPDQAAQIILEQLQTWGYLEASSGD